MVKNISKIANGSDVYYIKDADARSGLDGKTDKVVGTVNDNIALFDSIGNLKDSGKKVSDFHQKTDGNLIYVVANPTGTPGSTAFDMYNRTQWAGTINGITEITSGMIVLYKIPIAGCRYGVTLNINSLGEHPVVLNVDTKISTFYDAGVILPLIYDADLTAEVYVNHTNTSYTGCWKIANYDSDTTYIFSDGYNEVTNPAATVATVTNAINALAVVASSGSYDDLTNKPTITDTTYTFEGGTNKFTVTPLGGTAQDVTITPSIDNNVTGPNLTADKIVLGNGDSAVKTSSKGISTTSPSSSSDDTTIPTSKAVWNAITNGIAANDAMVYKGIIAGGSTDAYGALTPAANKGDTYKVTTAGKIDGIAVEIGDMIICNTDSTAAATSSDYNTIATKWDFILANIDGAVTGPASSTDENLASFNGATGKVVKDSGLTTANVSDAITKKHDHSTLTLSTTAQVYDGTHTLALPASDPYSSARTPSSHEHGNILDGGTLQTTDVTIASGDKLVVTDNSDDNKIARTSVSFDGSTTTKALTLKGTFETFLTSETDPTVPSWAKAASKPVYTPSEVGMISIVNTISQDTANQTAPSTVTGSDNTGKCANVLYVNGGTSDYNVSVSSSAGYITPGGELIVAICPQNGYCEICYLNVNGTIYVRAL